MTIGWCHIGHMSIPRGRPVRIVVVVPTGIIPVNGTPPGIVARRTIPRIEIDRATIVVPGHPQAEMIPSVPSIGWVSVAGVGVAPIPAVEGAIAPVPVSVVVVLVIRLVVVIVVVVVPIAGIGVVTPAKTDGGTEAYMIPRRINRPRTPTRKGQSNSEPVEQSRM